MIPLTNALVDRVVQSPAYQRHMAVCQRDLTILEPVWPSSSRTQALTQVKRCSALLQAHTKSKALLHYGTLQVDGVPILWKHQIALAYKHGTWQNARATLFILIYGSWPADRVQVDGLPYATRVRISTPNSVVSKEMLITFYHYRDLTQN